MLTKRVLVVVIASLFFCSTLLISFQYNNNSKQTPCIADPTFTNSNSNSNSNTAPSILTPTPSTPSPPSPPSPPTPATPSTPSSTTIVPSTPKPTPTLITDQNDGSTKYVFLEIGKGDGITKQKRHFIETIILGHTLNRTVIFPVFKQFIGDSAPLHFGDVLDEEYLRRSLKGLVKFVYQEDFDDFNSQFAASQHKVMQCPRPLSALKNALYGVQERFLYLFVEILDCTAPDGDEKPYRELFQSLIRSIRTAPKSRAMAEEVLTQVQVYKNDGILRPFVCLHARTEPDFRPVATVDMPTIISKMATHNFTHRGAPIEAVYVATGSAAESLAELKKQFPYVLHKENILPKDHPLLHTASDVDSFKALLDFEICLHSTIFVGHTSSIWSEMMHDLHRLEYAEDEWQKHVLTYTTRGNYLAPFCSANAYKYFAIDCDRINLK